LNSTNSSDYVFKVFEEEDLNFISISIDGLSFGMHEIIVFDTYGDGMNSSAESYVSITSGSPSDSSDAPLIYIAGDSYTSVARRKFIID